MMMKMSVHFGTLILFVCSGSFAGVEGSGGCQDPVCPSGDGRCKTADGEQLVVTISGKIASMESSCQTPLVDGEVRLYTGCAHSKEFNVEPAAGWKTGKDGTFEVSVPFKPGTSLLRTELCLTPRRGCQPLTLNVPAKKDPPYPGVRYAVAGATPISAAGGGRGVVGEARDDGNNKTVRVNLCLGEKKRRRRLAGWGDRDMSWLRKKSTEKRPDPTVGKRGWSNGIPWLKRPHPSLASFTRASEGEKRLWEGADDEVGWIKRRPMEEDDDDDDAERERAGENLPPNDDEDDGRDMSAAAAEHAGDVQPGKLRTAAAKEETSKSGLAPGHRWPRPEEMKKYWAQSDMSWL